MQPYQNYNGAEGTKECPHCKKKVGIIFIICPKCCKEIEKVNPVQDSPDGANYTPIGSGVIKKDTNGCMGWN